MTSPKDHRIERLTERQADILGVVDECGPVTTSEVGEYHLPIGYSSARSALEALEKRGLVGANYTSGKRGRAYETTRRGAAAVAAINRSSEDAEGAR